MSLSNVKAVRCDHMDRVSDLPSGVIDGILEHLNIRDLVRTSILSRKWRYMWISVPQLEFDEDFFNRYKHYDDPGPEISRIITQVLLPHNGPIYKFTLRIPYISNITISIEYFNNWILFLSRRGIKYLELVNLSFGHEQMLYDVFSCQELTYLILERFDLSVPPNFYGFKNLIVLQLQHITFKSGALQSLISGCPILEELKILFCHGFECIDFSAPTVKVLYIEVDEDIESVCLKKVKNLIDLTILTERDMVSGLIKSLPNIQRLAMKLIGKKILYADFIPMTLLRNSFRSLVYLKLTAVDLSDRKELLYIVRVIKSASNLVDLVIESYIDVDHTTQVSDHSEEFECIGCQSEELECVGCHSEELECSGCCLSRLQTVGITVKDSSQHAMSLIRFILRRSPSLEILSFYVFGLISKQSDAPKLFSISQVLLRMERASKRARVEFFPRK